MTKYSTIVLVVLLIAFGIFGLSSAQMMGMGNQHNHSLMNMTDSSAMPGTMSQGTMMNMGAMMGRMSSNHNMMTTEFSKLESHLNQMMQMNDLTALKAEMKKQQEMMSTMQQGMDQQQSMINNMVALMESNGMMKNDSMPMSHAGMMNNGSMPMSHTGMMNHNH